MTERYTGKKPSPNAPEEVQKKYREKIERNLVYYHKRYLEDDEFRQREIDRNRNRIKAEYKNDPAVRERMIKTASDYYYRKKAEKQAAEAAARSQ